MNRQIKTITVDCNTGESYIITLHGRDDMWSYNIDGQPERIGFNTSIAAASDALLRILERGEK